MCIMRGSELCEGFAPLNRIKSVQNCFTERPLRLIIFPFVSLATIAGSPDTGQFGGILLSSMYVQIGRTNDRIPARRAFCK